MQLSENPLQVIAIFAALFQSTRAGLRWWHSKHHNQHVNPDSDTLVISPLVTQSDMEPAISSAIYSRLYLLVHRS